MAWEDLLGPEVNEVVKLPDARLMAMAHMHNPTHYTAAILSGIAAAAGKSLKVL